MGKINAISFELSSSFGFFHWGKTKGDRRMTNIFISRTEVLGIIGAIIGINGYAQETFKKKLKVENHKPSFYEVLGGLNVGIIPKGKPVFFEDHLIHRPMNEINSRGSLMVKMSGLVEPKFQVIISQGSVEQTVYEKIVLYLKNGWAEFIPYFGKNQFPVAISNVTEEELEVVDGGEILIQSLYKERNTVEIPDLDSDDLKTGENFYYSDSLKDFSKTEIGKIVNEVTVWSSYEIELTESVYCTEDKLTISFL